MQTVIIFDFDGVLGDTLDEMLRIAGHVAAELGYPCQPAPADLDALERMEFSELGIQLGIPASQANEFPRRCFDLFASLSNPPHIFPGMKQVILDLAPTNRLAIVTGNTSRIVNRFLSEHGLDGCFAMVLGSDASGNRAEKLNQILATLGANAWRSLPGRRCGQRYTRGWGDRPSEHRRHVGAPIRGSSQPGEAMLPGPYAPGAAKLPERES